MPLGLPISLQRLLSLIASEDRAKLGPRESNEFLVGSKAAGTEGKLGAN